MKRIILLCFAIALACFVIYYFKTGNKEYDREVKQELKGVVTAKYRVQKNNPKAVNVRINDSIVYYLPFSLISEINIGDTINKERGKDYYIFRTETKIIKMKLPKPNLLGYPKDWRGSLEITPR
jgi:hypothetical protein